MTAAARLCSVLNAAHAAATLSVEAYHERYSAVSACRSATRYSHACRRRDVHLPSHLARVTVAGLAAGPQHTRGKLRRRLPQAYQKQNTRLPFNQFWQHWDWRAEIVTRHVLLLYEVPRRRTCKPCTHVVTRTRARSRIYHSTLGCRSGLLTSVSTMASIFSPTSSIDIPETSST